MLDQLLFQDLFFIKVDDILCNFFSEGRFTNFLFPHNEKLFEGANIDVMVFRYEKCEDSPRKKTYVNGKEVFYNVNNGIITFGGEDVVGSPISDEFSVYVGFVSGRDAVYRAPFGNIDMLTDKGKVEKYIFTETFPTQNMEIDKHLQAHKSELIGRKIRTFSETNWFQWGAPRNISNIKRNAGKPCIYLRIMTRQKEVAFLGNVQYFGGTLLCLVPKSEMDEVELQRIVHHINSESFQNDYIYSGRFKIGHKQLSNAMIPSTGTAPSSCS